MTRDVVAMNFELIISSCPETRGGKNIIQGNLFKHTKSSLGDAATVDPSGKDF